MTFTKQEIKIKSSDNIHELNGIIYIPEGDIKGIFHLVHGMTEYIARYDHIFSFLAQNGYVCCGYDNLGHGHTANDGELGFIAHKDGWRYLVKDVNVFGTAIRERFKDKKYFLMGHSMGSFIVRMAAKDYGNSIDKLIICGTGGPNPLSLLGISIIDIIKFFKGEKAYSNFVYALTFGSYNKRFENKTNYDWLTKNEENIKKYIADKYCNFRFTLSALRDLVMLNYMSNKKEWFKSIRKDLPILLVSGDMDPVGNYGKGVKAVFEGLKSYGKQNVTLKLYENCRHEIHNDTCHEEMFSDILSFIKK